MALPEVVTRSEWLEARKELLAREKAFTKERDRLSARRRQLPMVRVDKAYAFTGPEGTVGLRRLFGDSRQLVLQHFMFDPAWDEGCPSCSGAADEMSDGLLRHLRARDTAFVAVSRAPADKIARYQAQRGWTFPWYSSYGSDFNYDFNVTIDSSVAPVLWNYRTLPELEAAGMGWLGEGSSEQPGYSFFLRDGDDVFHTYSTYARGTEGMGGVYSVLDMTALGRQEEWEEPKGRVETPRAGVPDFTA
ncbi:MAG: DUF899 domain-containing protein [Acidimicrobiales bacterium]|jgi:predicted dithiol-disulfide oxidoreductase (DUF899 family)